MARHHRVRPGGTGHSVTSHRATHPGAAGLSASSPGTRTRYRSPVDIEDSPDEAAFRAEARDWLADNAPAKGSHADFSDAFFDPNVDAGWAIARSADWQRTLWAGGWAGISYPRQWAGRGGSLMQEMIFAEEMAGFGVMTGSFAVAHSMVGPAILAFGTDEQRARFIPAMLRGDEMWCQLFSEPGAGSDLAGLATRARRDGDGWVVNGQKVWTSHADTSQFGILLARTDVDAPKHRGITYFLLDMAAEGIDVRPLRQMTGESQFSEVFLTDVVIPDAAVLGGTAGIGQGWPAAVHTLANERAMIGSAAVMADVEPVVRLARRTGRIDDPVVRQELSAAHTRMQILRYLGYRARTAISQGKEPGPESSVIKLAFADHFRRTSSLAKSLSGSAGMLDDDGSEGASMLTWRFLFSPSTGIAGGTNEVQRSIIGERVLGLPREPRPPAAVVDPIHPRTERREPVGTTR
jgi:alkylation response protein AidB-like acyl-CoA dehydrogenase